MELSCNRGQDQDQHEKIEGVDGPAEKARLQRVGGVGAGEGDGDSTEAVAGLMECLS
jgi:hypothetical protein